MCSFKATIFPVWCQRITLTNNTMHYYTIACTTIMYIHTHLHMYAYACVYMCSATCAYATVPVIVGININDSDLAVILNFRY